MMRLTAMKITMASVLLVLVIIEGVVIVMLSAGRFRVAVKEIQTPITAVNSEKSGSEL